MKVDDNLVKIAEETEKLSEIGVITDNVQMFKIELMNMLVHCYDNIAIFDEAQKNNLQNIFNYTINL